MESRWGHPRVADEATGLRLPAPVPQAISASPGGLLRSYGTEQPPPGLSHQWRPMKQKNQIISLDVPGVTTGGRFAKSKEEIEAQSESESRSEWLYIGGEMLGLTPLRVAAISTALRLSLSTCVCKGTVPALGCRRPRAGFAEGPSLSSQLPFSSVEFNSIQSHTS
ncbi:hypothetical protein NDU88_004449 [Pleurodeles waltl]|uniref:Uncharacterized protein n=1 Tax=Pleurodeles waltl TaxID=8319 RepID=A0AAV7VGA4_PLEWA|nr:hypothetical protein NDU88_004449 [Pleurodeles waltl]